jgi:hypothetical protein
VNVFCKVNSFLKRKLTLCRTSEMTHIITSGYINMCLSKVQIRSGGREQSDRDLKGGLFEDIFLSIRLDRKTQIRPPTR